MNPVISALQEIAPIVQWTVWPTSDAQGDDLACPPIIAWSYQQPTKELRGLLELAVATFDGAVRWIIQFGDDCRWVLLPVRIVECDRERRLNGYLVAAAQIKALDPEFGKRANGELAILSQYLRSRLIEKKSA